MGTLVLVRHGQSRYNLENRFTGLIDISLTATGIEQAKNAGKMLKGYPLHYGFTSLLKRAADTLSIILEEANQNSIPVIRDQSLNERHFGDLEGLTKEEAVLRFGSHSIANWMDSYEACPPSGESIKDTSERTIVFYSRQIIPLLKAGNNVIVVGHGVSLRTLRSHIEEAHSGNRDPAPELQNAIPHFYPYSQYHSAPQNKSL